MSHRIHFLIFTGLLLMFCSCRKENRFEWQVNQRHMEVSLNKESDSLYVIHLNTDQPSHSVWKLPYPVYQFDYGDVTGDGMPEIIVWVIHFIHNVVHNQYPPDYQGFTGVFLLPFGK